MKNTIKTLALITATIGVAAVVKRVKKNDTILHRKFDGLNHRLYQDQKFAGYKWKQMNPKRCGLIAERKH